MKMAKDTILAVKDAEIKAEETIKNASKEAEAAIAKARKDADKLIDDEVRKAQKAAEEKLAAAKTEADKIAAEGEKKAAEEIEKMKKDAAGKEKAAIQAVISQLV